MGDLGEDNETVEEEIDDIRNENDIDAIDSSKANLFDVGVVSAPIHASSN